MIFLSVVKILFCPLEASTSCLDAESSSAEEHSNMQRIKII